MPVIQMYKLFDSLKAKLQTSCRLLLINGLTGMGKTALAECLAVETIAGDRHIRYYNISFDGMKEIDFTSAARRSVEGDRIIAGVRGSALGAHAPTTGLPWVSRSASWRLSWSSWVSRSVVLLKPYACMTRASSWWCSL